MKLKKMSVSKDSQGGVIAASKVLFAAEIKRKQGWKKRKRQRKTEERNL